MPANAQRTPVAVALASATGTIERGRNSNELQLCVALQDLQIRDVGPLAELGVNELVVVGEPPGDPHVANDWVSALAEHWMSAMR